MAAVVCLLVFGGSRGPALYRNLDGHLYSVNTQSRQPGEDGLYHLRFACDGEVVELTADSEELVLKIDAMPVLGLTADKNGAITPAGSSSAQVDFGSPFNLTTPLRDNHAADFPVIAGTMDADLLAGTVDPEIYPDAKPPVVVDGENNTVTFTEGLRPWCRR